MVDEWVQQELVDKWTIMNKRAGCFAVGAVDCAAFLSDAADSSVPVL